MIGRYQPATVNLPWTLSAGAARASGDQRLVGEANLVVCLGNTSGVWRVPARRGRRPPDQVWPARPQLSKGAKMTGYQPIRSFRGAAVLAFVLACSACGGGSSSGGTAGTTGSAGKASGA